MWRETEVVPQVTFGVAAAYGSGHQGGHQDTHWVGRAAPPRLICLLSAQVHTSVVFKPMCLLGTALDCATRTTCLSNSVQKSTRPSREHIPLS